MSDSICARASGVSGGAPAGAGGRSPTDAVELEHQRAPAGDGSVGHEGNAAPPPTIAPLLTLQCNSLSTERLLSLSSLAPSRLVLLSPPPLLECMQRCHTPSPLSVVPANDFAPFLLLRCRAALRKPTLTTRFRCVASMAPRKRSLRSLSRDLRAPTVLEINFHTSDRPLRSLYTSHNFV